MAQNLPRGTPARVLVILTLLIGLVVVSAWRDALRRDRDTWVRFPTALGDTGLLQPGHLPVTLTTGGKTVSLSPRGPGLQRRDDRMFRVLTDAGTGLPFTLFTTQENLGAEEDPKLYARTAPHRFQRLHARLGPSPTPPAPAPVPGLEPEPEPDLAGNPAAFPPPLDDGSPLPAAQDPDSLPALKAPPSQSPTVRGPVPARPAKTSPDRNPANAQSPKAVPSRAATESTQAAATNKETPAVSQAPEAVPSAPAPEPVDLEMEPSPGPASSVAPDQMPALPPGTAPPPSPPRVRPLPSSATRPGARPAAVPPGRAPAPGEPIRRALPVEDEEPFMEDPPISDKTAPISPKKGGL